MIEFRIRKRRDYIGLPGWIQCNHEGPYKKDIEGAREGGRQCNRKAGIRLMCFADGGRGHKAIGGTKGKEMCFSPQILQKEPSLLTP